MIGRFLYLWYRRRLAGLPSCIKSLAVAWYKDLTNVINEVTTSTTTVLDWDGSDDSVSLSAHPDVTGNKIIVFNAKFESYGVSQAETVFVFGNDDGDYLEVVYITNLNRLRVAAATAGGTANGDYDISSYIGVNTRFVISKTTGDVNSVTANENTLSLAVAGSGANSAASGSTIGHHPDYGVYAYFNHGLIWGISVGGENSFIGYPNGNTDAAWDDSIGAITATVNGSPTTTTIALNLTSGQIQDAIGTRTDIVYYGQYLDATSGQINFYRTTGTYDYTDPYDGSRSEDNAIPVDGLLTIPANGICDIGINRDGTWDGTNHSIYENFYPVVERAGTVLHDILEDSKHVSVATPSWSETLYGSDFLNQCGFSDKELYDQLGYNWETVVNGSAVTLDDDCLIPVAKWDYQFVFADGEQVFIDGEALRVKVNI